MIPSYLPWVGFAIFGSNTGMYTVSTNSAKFVAEPSVTKPWFIGRRCSAAILLTSRSGVSAGARLMRFRFRILLPSMKLSCQ